MLSGLLRQVLPETILGSPLKPCNTAPNALGQMTIYQDPIIQLRPLNYMRKERLLFEEMQLS